MATSKAAIVAAGGYFFLCTGFLGTGEADGLRLDGAIPRQVLERYLSRAIIMMDRCTGPCYWRCSRGSLNQGE